MSDDRVLLFSDEWLTKYGELLSKNEEYKRTAKNWHGDFIFEVTPDKSLSESQSVYMWIYRRVNLSRHISHSQMRPPRMSIQVVLRTGGYYSMAR